MRFSVYRPMDFKLYKESASAIKFTMDYSTSIDKLETDLYCKPNDTHLHFMHNDVTIMCIKDLMHKRIWSIEKKPHNRLEQLKPRYEEDDVNLETVRVKLVQRSVSFQKLDKKVDESLTLVLTYYSALNQLYEILRRVHKHVLKLPRLHGTPSSTTRKVFRYPKTIRNKLVRSKLKEFIYKNAGTNFCDIYLKIYVKICILENIRKWRSVWKYVSQEKIPH